MDEGLCAPCQRLVAIAEDGTIAKHTVWYTEYGKWYQRACSGTGLKPDEMPEET
jgi:hypothetical protein